MPARKKKKASKKRQTSTLHSLKRSGVDISKQFVIATLSFFALAILSGSAPEIFSTGESKATSLLPPATITLEHEAALSITMTLARKGESGYASIENQSDDAIEVSIPESWTRTEVSGAAIQSMTSQKPVFGSIRWTLPAHAGIKFHVPHAPGSLQFINASASATAAVTLSAVDLTGGITTRDVFLVQKIVSVPLWQGEE